MARRKLSEVVRYLRQLTDSANGSGASDAELLERYVHYRDEAAFELLLWRHGALVFNVCRRILPREQDAEDAFQATFLAFVRKAPVIVRGGSVASWLYKVAYRVALEARERTRKTEAREKSGDDLLAQQSAFDAPWSDVRSILDEELNRLPERLRRPFVLCYLEGKSNEEAARELGCRLGTIYSRLSRGREMLRQRLLRRGVSLSLAALMAALAEHAVEAAPAIPLLRSAARTALSFVDPSAIADISPRVATLAEGVLRTMFVTKIKIVAVMLFVASVVAAGSALTHGLTAAPQAETQTEDAAPKQEAARKADAEPIPVKVVKPAPGGLARSTTRSAEVFAAQQQQLVALVSGTVKEVAVDLGDRVKKGQVLIVLDAPLLAKEVEQATADLEIAQAQMEEARASVAVAEAEANIGGDPGKIKAAKLAHAKAAVNAAKANVKARRIPVDKARIQESFTRLRAEFDGVVTRRNADPGNLVQVGEGTARQPLLTLVRMDRVRVVVHLPQGIATLAEHGDPVELSLEVGAIGNVARDLHLIGNPKDFITGQKIARISPIIDGASGMRSVVIEVENAKNRLLPGMSIGARVHFERTRSAKGFVVPSGCVVADGGRKYLWIVRDGKAHRTPVTVSVDDGSSAEISKGLTASDLIAISNQSELAEGSPVQCELLKKWP